MVSKLPRLSSRDMIAARPDLALVSSHNPTVIEDLLFLDAWVGGVVPTLAGLLRARQIRRANPVLEGSARPD